MIQLSASDRGKVDDLLRKCFPDATIDDDVRTSLVVGLHQSDRPDIGIDWSRYENDIQGVLTSESLTKTRGELLRSDQADGLYRYYKIASTHDREKPDYPPFTGHLHMARVTLPKTKVKSFSTAVGKVIPNDHLLGTIEEVSGKFGGLIAKPISRVDLITPARSGGARFGAVSMYLGYEGGDLPSFYILEAGTATGTPKTLYLAPTLDHRIVDFSGYVPTPFASATHVYVGKTTFAGDSPKLLEMTVHKDTSSTPYMKLSVVFGETASAPFHIWPGFLIARAALIVLGRALDGVKKP
jgi:hypothetical protein